MYAKQKPVANVRLGSNRQFRKMTTFLHMKPIENVCFQIIINEIRFRTHFLTRLNDFTNEKMLSKNSKADARNKGTGRTKKKEQKLKKTLMRTITVPVEVNVHLEI